MTNFDFKHATDDELREKYKQIAREANDDQFFTRKELWHLPKILDDKEQVLSFSSGMMDGNTWLIALTDRRVIFLNKGLIYGLTQASIDLDKINAVSGKTGIIFGTISIEDAAKERVITMVPKMSVVAFTNRLRDAMELRKSKASKLSEASVHSLIEDLEKLASLRDRGILTEVEFEKKKAELIGK